MQADEIMMVGPGQRVHARTDELCRWGAIRLPASDFVADEPVEFNVALLIKIEVPQHVDGDHMPGWAAEHVDGDHVVGIDAAALFRSR